MTLMQSERNVLPAGDGMALFLSVMAAIFWGSVFEATRLVLQDLTPWTAVASRFVFASAATLIWLWLKNGFDWQVFQRNLVAFVVLGAVGIAGFSGLLFWGMKSSSPVTAALIMATNPLLTNLIDAFIRRRRPRKREVVGMMLSIVGVGLTVGIFGGTHFTPGDVLILIASLVWAFYSIGSRNWVKSASPLETSVWTTVFGTVFLVIAALVLADPMHELQTASLLSWSATLWMALTGSVLAYLFWQIGIAVRGPAATSVVYNLVPVSALVIAAGFGRLPDVIQVLGVFVTIFGVLLASGRLPSLRG